jgi:hypothetical protein
VQTPGVTRNRDEYLEYIVEPRPFKDLALLESKIRIVGDVALIHGRTSYTMIADGAEHEALYPDVYQKRDGTWVCVSACTIARALDTGRTRFLVARHLCTRVATTQEPRGSSGQQKGATRCTTRHQ